MKSIILSGLSLVFDANDGDIRQQIIDALGCINGTLQREPYGLGAQIVWNIAEDGGFSFNYEVEEGEDDGDIESEGDGMQRIRDPTSP